MKLTAAEYQDIRKAIASLPADVSNDAIGNHAPKLEELYAPETHAAALDPEAPIVLGVRGTGKSFWAGVLGKEELREAAATAYPKLGLNHLNVQFGFTGLDSLNGIGREKLDACVPANAGIDEARFFWWATILYGLAQAEGKQPTKLSKLLPAARDLEEREAILDRHEKALHARSRTLLIVYDALDTMAISWPRRQLLTQALLEVVWSMRAYRAIRLKLFLRPDQLEDDALRFVELPKLRTGAVRLTWPGTDLYGLLFARLALSDASVSFGRLLESLGLRMGSRTEILARHWSLGHDVSDQKRLMTALTGPYMADGAHGYKKGNTYDWPLAHLGDAFNEVTPRSFLGLAIAAATYGAAPPDRVLTPDGIRHGLRAASKTRVDQLHQEFPWIKGVLAPLAGLLLPQEEKEVFTVWRKTRTLPNAIADAQKEDYLPPFPESGSNDERSLYMALERIGVMLRRKDGRLDMPDLFRVAAKLLKKGATAPL
ncbi:hypothetical protein [Stigmatella aurantiaca]|uniref:Conserved uncharacterized protein n=1 Tax=Stigmatella aurantiaca (strain DW4/3-1) TaxID=378806 RepID=Q099P8_STIAD|nr:hypothetical protein [Stigmatella aurantiaca]ADO75862.1 conserved uncharacterized protein [Stigmatella aurantiaca DW4/3-1]EAU68433.1 conserved hypothetical protein [Stigmatella aurantiaca DW4/3-1]